MTDKSIFNVGRVLASVKPSVAPGCTNLEIEVPNKVLMMSMDDAVEMAIAILRHADAANIIDFAQRDEAVKILVGESLIREGDRNEA